MTIWWSLVLFLGGMLTGAGVDMLLGRYVMAPRPVEGPHRIEGTGVTYEADPAHRADHHA